MEPDANAKPQHIAGWISACLFALLVLFFSTVMLICNSYFVYVVVRFIPLPKEQVPSAVIAQLFYFLGPIALTFLEWYMFDRLKRAFS